MLSGILKTANEHKITEYLVLEYPFPEKNKNNVYLLEDDLKLSFQMNSALFIGPWKSSLCFSVLDLRSNKCFPRGILIHILSFTYFILISWESPNYSAFCFSLPEFYIRKSYFGSIDFPGHKDPHGHLVNFLLEATSCWRLSLDDNQ